MRAASRLVAAAALVILGVLAVNVTRSDVTVTFAAADTRGLSQDVVFRCEGATSFDGEAGGALQAEGSDAYYAWSVEQAKKTVGTPPDTAPAVISACDEARDSRLITLVWLLAGAVASGCVLLTVVRIPARDR